MARNLIVAALIYLISTTAVVARPPNNVSHRELLKRADLVVIVQPIESNDHTVGDPHIAIRETDAKFLTAVVTKCLVTSVLKGALKDESIAIPHYRLDWTKAEANGIVGIGNGPSLVKFKIDTESTDPFQDAFTDGRYLVYLIQEADGDYTFVTGQFDASYSVFSLTPHRRDSK